MILVKHHDSGNLVPYFYWAMEEYILEHLLKDDEVYFSTWPIFGTIVGKNQILENEVNLSYTKEKHIPVYRRPSGGGAVYADANNMMFTIAKKRNKDFSFAQELALIVETLNKFGIPAQFSGRNDIVIEGKKISGNSFIQNKHGMIIHGTLLFDTDLETMIRCITPSNEKLVSKGIDSIRSRVTNIKAFVGAKTLTELRQFIETTLTDKTYELSDDEIAFIHQQGKKFATRSYIYDEQPLHTKVIKKRLDGGTFNISLDISYGIIKNIYIKGDYFEKVPIRELEDKFKEVAFNAKTLKQLFTTFAVSDFIIGATNSSFLEALCEQISS